jgi:hypothetical protein
MANNSLSTPSTPVGLSRSLSITSFTSDRSDVFSEPRNPSKFNPWILFRLARGREKEKEINKKVNSLVTHKVLHYCLLYKKKRPNTAVWSVTSQSVLTQISRFLVHTSYLLLCVSTIQTQVTLRYIRTEIL